jgi:hypothetical protein
MVFHPDFWKAFDASLPQTLASRATSLDRDENFGLLAVWVAGNGFLIFRPEPCVDCFFDVGENFLLVVPLRNTSGKRPKVGPAA